MPLSVPVSPRATTKPLRYSRTCWTQVIAKDTLLQSRTAFATYRTHTQKNPAFSIALSRQGLETQENKEVPGSTTNQSYRRDDRARMQLPPACG